MQARHQQKGGRNTSSQGKKKTDVECYNCHKTGHISNECWAKGGGHEGQGPKGRQGPNRGDRSHQTQDSVNNSLGDCAYMVNQNIHEFSKYDWVLDSATTSHICTT
ncbi:uncharacterized protein LACBIDRAFT_316933 [Laccaria bicolor S238N-H82]|uniref:Predicted protein n=1 Tax=Laccaria bicolor (strain S238N-H82 / ATCC MYA-4686) TaxID=486041 RepID=B0D5A9_LACBS|nr:uncharacterized protein LACBIDRAFT_316933 [Laccaria bicolor S238N-H82]EDR10241.1 predicted protein [Laccaria bicolor S238N-H82]|eukprot:XP_001878691.1 predicted protein [Laccaria bicolor S238N-H82]